MSTTIAPDLSLAADIDAACERIAPTWPLDRFIAVNPHWGWRGHPIAEAAATLATLAGTALTMPQSWFREELAAGRLDVAHLAPAAEAAGDPQLAGAAQQVLLDDEPSPPLARMPLVSDLRDRSAPPVPGRTWTDQLVHEIGQHCASLFDDAQASWALVGRTRLFESWRREPAVTHGFAWRHGNHWARERLDSLPAGATEAIEAMLADLGVPAGGRQAYLTALLLSVNGWASWCAFRRWEARLADGDDDIIVDLLAVRLAWDWLLAADGADELGGLLADWATAWSHVDVLHRRHAEQQRVDWVLQDALERTYQASIIEGLPSAIRPGTPPEVQAVFCIDVRSEVFRRALEAASPDVATRGFAGFFGLPIAYAPVGSTFTRPQLPGLLSPALRVTEAPAAHDEALGAEVPDRAQHLAPHRAWDAFRRSPASMFSFVETLGLAYAPKLVTASLAHSTRPEPWEHDGLAAEARSWTPRLALADDDPAAAAAVAHKVLTAMGLVEGFAPLVLLCGHGSATTNNPHAAGLDCGACGGQTGEVNARALADLLNDPTVRAHLASLGIAVPAGTWFLPAMHVTTTDEVELFDVGRAPESHRTRIAALVTWLREAGDRARAERADALGLGHLVDQPRELRQAVVTRALDWAQVRPEWGLAGNAAFVVAPRWRTRHLDLGGRCFLHDYDHRLDPDLAVLTLIMTAPMVVTHWINLQYHASTVDHRRYGSGNKVLHNVVGGHLGVFEGNGGDLRIGLSEQSLHDGTTLRHPPLRLSVFVEAPREAIDRVHAEHRVVRDLVDHGWLHLLRIDPHTGLTERRDRHGWTVATALR